MKKKLLAVFAHPDDEAFGPGGTIAKYAATDVDIHLLCATKGEEGEWDEEHKLRTKNEELKTKNQINIEHVREKELQKSAKILGVKSVEFMGFTDGRLCNAVYHDVAQKIIDKITMFKPHVIVTMDRLGVSGHLDHIAISMMTTYAFIKTKFPRKLYYHCLPREWRSLRMRKYFIYFPEGYTQAEITTRIRYAPNWFTRSKAMQQHESQAKDVQDITKFYRKRPKIDHFILKYFRGGAIRCGETDLFAGIK